MTNQRIEFKLQKSGYATRTGSTRAATIVYPATVTHWENFEANAADDTGDDDLEVTDMPLAYTLKESKEVDSEENVRQRIFIDISTPLNCCSVGKMHVGDSGVRNAANILRNDIGLSKFSLTNMDIICRNSADYIFAVGEVKTEWSSHDMPINGGELSSRYQVGSSENKKWQRIIAQLFGYQIDQCCTYGFISNYNTTWFCKVGVDSLAISNGIPCDFYEKESAPLTDISTTTMSSTSNSNNDSNNDSNSGLSNSKKSHYDLRSSQPSSDCSSSSISGTKRSSEHIEEVEDSNNGRRQNSYLRCMYHFMKIAKNNTIEFPAATKKIRRDSAEFQSNNNNEAESNSKRCDDSSQDDSQDVSPDKTGSQGQDSNAKTEGSKRCGGSEGDGVDGLNKTAFSLSRAVGVLGRGRRGMVFKYEPAGSSGQNEKHCAVKLVDLERTGNQEALHAEMETYKLLEGVQGE